MRKSGREKVRDPVKENREDCSNGSFRVEGLERATEVEGDKGSLKERETSE